MLPSKDVETEIREEIKRLQKCFIENQKHKENLVKFSNPEDLAAFQIYVAQHGKKLTTLFKELWEGLTVLFMEREKKLGYHDAEDAVRAARFSQFIQENCSLLYDSIIEEQRATPDSCEKKLPKRPNVPIEARQQWIDRATPKLESVYSIAFTTLAGAMFLSLGMQVTILTLAAIYNYLQKDISDTMKAGFAPPPSPPVIRAAEEGETGWHRRLEKEEAEQHLHKARSQVQK